MDFERITIDPHQMGGVACIRGLRIPVSTVVAMVADGMTVEEILSSSRFRLCPAASARSRSAPQRRYATHGGLRTRLRVNQSESGNY